MTVQLSVKDKTFSYDIVEGWEILPFYGLFGGHVGYGLHVKFLDKQNDPNSWFRVVVSQSKEQLETVLATIRKAVNEAEDKGGGIVSIDNHALTVSVS